MLVLGLGALAQATPRINELQASNSSIVTGDRGDTPDWIELYNPAAHSIDLKGMRFVVAGRQHRFEHSLIIAPQGFLVLWCDGKPKRGIQHIGFKLSKHAGSVLLVAQDGVTILDAFTWQDLPNGSSMARMPDGGPSWGYADDPTPGKANSLLALRTRRLDTPELRLDTLADGSIRVCAEAQAGGVVRYTLDGSPVTDTTAALPEGPMTLPLGSVMRFKATADDALPSRECMITLPWIPSEEAITCLAMDPGALHGDSMGIDTPGRFANNTRSGKAWERQALLGLGDTDPINVGIRISGSGSRGSAKRSFKLYTRGRYDSPEAGIPLAEGGRFDEAILRADASPFAFLRNRFIETIVQRHALAVDVQVSTPTALYLNGHYWGLYRWLPPKDAAWCKAISGAEAVDVLAGPGHVPISGSDAHFMHARDALFRSAPLDSLEELMDLNSLVDLACLDLWTGRPDHDLNVRCYRPRRTGGRWRWILYDMDLWSPVELNSVEAMCAAGMPEAPYVPQLLAHPELQMRLLARMVVLQATAFMPEHATALADSIHAAHEAELLADHDRWEPDLGGPHPSLVRESMRNFIAERSQYVMEHLAEHSGRKLRSLAVDVPEATEGTVYLNGCVLPAGRQRISCFSRVPLELRAVPATDMEFVGWKGSPDQGPQVMVDPAEYARVRPLFRIVVP